MNLKNFDLLTKGFQFPYQYMFNSLQLNNGFNKFNNIAHFANTAKTDWSWSALVEDFDMDGKKDIYVTNGYRKYARDNDFQQKVNDLKAIYKNQTPPLVEKEKLLAQIPSEKLQNIFYQQDGPNKFKNTANKVGMDQLSFSNGAAYGDLDNDGDLDFVVNNIDQEAFVYENKTSVDSKNYLILKLEGLLSEHFAKVRLYENGNVQFKEAKRVRGYLSSVTSNLHFTVSSNKVDSIIVDWPSGKKNKLYQVNSNEILVVQETTAKNYSYKVEKSQSDMVFSTFGDKVLSSFFEHKESNYNDFGNEVLLPFKQSTLGPILATEDLNKDSKADFFIGGSSGNYSKLLMSSDKGYVEKRLTHFESEDVSAVFFDLDSDNDLDLYVVTGGNEFESNSKYYQDRLYINNNGEFTFSQSLENKNVGHIGKPIDFDNDGDLDLIVGNRVEAQQYPTPSKSVLLENKNGKLIDVTSKFAQAVENFGIVNDIEVKDINNDGWQDLLLVGEWTGVGIFENVKGNFEQTASQELLNKLGWWQSITDLGNDKNGNLRFLIGNFGTNNKYKVSDKKPLKVFVNDFNGNGKNDMVLSYDYNGRLVPFRGKECSTEQAPHLADKFPSYSLFANASIRDVYGSKIDSALQFEINDLQSYILTISEDGFNLEALPKEAQYLPINDALAKDLNQDGFKELILIGNTYNMEVESPRMDFSSAIVLMNDQHNYKYSKELSGQLNHSKNSKSIMTASYQSKDLLIIGQNNDKASIYSITK